jgi:hypothetical protein
VVPVAPPPEPLAGVTDQSMFLRSPDNEFVFFPNGRLQVDTLLYKSRNKVPTDTMLVRTARLELAGWFSNLFYFYISGDFAAAPPSTTPAPTTPASLATVDNYIGIAPWGTLAMFQVGQYDAPFTLDNHSSDKYIDFMERSLTARFGVSQTKDIGGMLSGYDEKKHFYYSAGLFNGDGRTFRNVDEHFDWIGRAWVAPFSFMGDGPLHDITIGGSFLSGYRKFAQAPANQSTQESFSFLSFSPYTTSMTSGLPATNVGFRQFHHVSEGAFELNAPIAHKFGLRYELVYRHVPLTEDVIAANGTGAHIGQAKLTGTAMYGEAWVWALGDDKIIGDTQGVEPFPRYKKFGVKAPQDGVQILGKIESLNEKVTEAADTAAFKLGNKAVGRTHVNVYELGVNYWHSKRYRATVNYVFNYFQKSGTDTSPAIRGLKSPAEHEIAFRLAVAL